MKVQVFATKPDGFFWKAPSWSDGRGFAIDSGTELDLSDEDLAALDKHVRDGYWLRYVAVVPPVLVKEKAGK
jgi:hypothetical protein